jgi:hypothetical protein
MADNPFQNAPEDSEGWKRFERAVDAAVKSGPKHKPAKPANSAEKMKDSKNAHDKRDSSDNRGGDSGN